MEMVDINNEWHNKIKRVLIIGAVALSLSVALLIIGYCFSIKGLIGISFMGIIITFIISISFSLSDYIELKVINRKYESLSEEEKKEWQSIILYYTFSQPIDFDIFSGYYVFTKKRIYLLNNDFSVDYKDIIMMYDNYIWYKHLNRHDSGLSIFQSNRSLVLITKQGNAVRIPFDTYKKIKCYGMEETTSLEDLILSKNKNILVGYTEENINTIKEKYPIDMDKLDNFGG